MNELELRHLNLLIDSRKQVSARARFYDAELEDFVLALRESGASAASIAAVAGVSDAAVQKWTQHARARRDAQ